MKKTIMLLTLFAGITFNGLAQKQKVIRQKTEKQIAVASFDQLTVDGNFKLTLVENENPTIVVNGSSRFIKALKVQQNKKPAGEKPLYRCQGRT